MAAIPAAQVALLAEAAKCTGVPVSELFAGEVTLTTGSCDCTTVIFKGVLPTPPQLSQACTTVLYVPGERLTVVSMRLALAVKTALDGAE
jgi:hypothetical protein